MLIEVTPEQGAAIDAACASDRVWFLAHPEERERIRPLIGGEFAPEHIDAGAQHVLVTQIRPGVRTRRPFEVYFYAELAVKPRP
jgi:hypothetical protein